MVPRYCLLALLLCPFFTSDYWYRGDVVWPFGVYFCSDYCNRGDVAWPFGVYFCSDYCNRGDVAMSIFLQVIIGYRGKVLPVWLFVTVVRFIGSLVTNITIRKLVFPKLLVMFSPLLCAACLENFVCLSCRGVDVLLPAGPLNQFRGCLSIYGVGYHSCSCLSVVFLIFWLSKERR